VVRHAGCCCCHGAEAWLQDLQAAAQHAGEWKAGTARNTIALMAAEPNNQFRLLILE
jgi:hypothetical protein